MMDGGCVERDVGESGCSCKGMEGTNSEGGWVVVGCVWVFLQEGL